MSDQIIFPGAIISNEDPMMLGRVRAYPIIEGRESIVKSFCKTCFDDIPEIKRWTNEDPFLYLPLLPFYISQTPKKDEFVHLFYYSKSTKFKNQFYIQGPLTSPMNSQLETSESIQNYMLTGKIDDTNRRVRGVPEIKGIYPEPGDVSILGRGSSDLVIKENEVLLRAGKYSDTYTNSKDLPTINDKRSFIQLTNTKQKKQDKSLETLITFEENVTTVKYLIEWGILNPENNFNAYTGFVSIYSVKPDLSTNTKNLKINSSISTFLSAPIYNINFIGKTFDQTVSLINDFITGFDQGKIIPSDFSSGVSNYPDFTSPSDRYPFAFRPNILTYNFTYDNDPNKALERETVEKFISEIKINGNDKVGCVIVYSKGSTENSRRPKINDYVPSTYVIEEASYNILGGEEIFFISHNTKIPELKKIDLSNTLYGIPPQMMSTIQKNTNSMVRGEQLMDFLNLVVKFMLAHVHPFPGIPPVPVATDGTTSAEILQKLFDAPNTILNQNIRLN